MDHAERLADYLAGQLAADEQAAFEAQLARDPALRAQLEAARLADASLQQLESPIPPEGFEARLNARLDRELPALLDASATPAQATAPVDELAERRARRTPPRWVLATTGAAAALVLVAGGGLALQGMLGSGADETADGATITQTFGLDADDAAEEADDEVAAGEMADGPLIVAQGRELDDVTADALAEDDLAFGLAERGLDSLSAAGARSSFLDVFTDGPPAPEAESMEAPADDADEVGDAAEPGTLDAPDAADEDRARFAIDPDDPRLRTGGVVTDDDLDAVARCLEVVLHDSPDAIPTYAELGVRDGDEVVAIGLVTRDPASDTFARRELWLLDRTTCDVRHIVQR